MQDLNSSEGFFSRAAAPGLVSEFGSEKKMLVQHFIFSTTRVSRCGNSSKLQFNATDSVWRHKNVCIGRYLTTLIHAFAHKSKCSRNSEKPFDTLKSTRQQLLLLIFSRSLHPPTRTIPLCAPDEGRDLLASLTVRLASGYPSPLSATQLLPVSWFGRAPPTTPAPPPTPPVRECQAVRAFPLVGTLLRSHCSPSSFPVLLSCLSSSSTPPPRRLTPHFLTPPHSERSLLAAASGLFVSHPGLLNGLFISLVPQFRPIFHELCRHFVPVFIPQPPPNVTRLPPISTATP